MSQGYRRFVQFVCCAVAIAAATPTVLAVSQAGSGLGVVSFPVSCDESVQSDFDHAVALLHHMTYPQARAAFEAIIEDDPRCAMAHWGVAMTLFQPLWPTRPTPEDLSRGWGAVERARELEPATERERLFIEAAAAFFENPAEVDYWQRVARWERAMAAVHAANPDDAEATAFFALAHLAVAASGSLQGGDRDTVAELLSGLYAAHPDHPGVLHYLIHVSDAHGRESDFLDAVQQYDAIAPRNPHALHMPTHIYTRLGDWDAVIAGNERAAEAALEHPAGDNGNLVWDEFPHAVEYLVYASLQKGDDAEAAARIERLLSIENLQPGSKTAFHLASVRARYALERRAWDEAAALEPRTPEVVDWDAHPWPDAILRFAHGLGSLHVGDRDAAHEETAVLGELEGAAFAAGEDLAGMHIRILRMELDAWIAAVEGSPEVGIALLRAAADLEESTAKPPVTPAPTLPAAELLGDLLLAEGDEAGAIEAYERALSRHPGRFNSLLGAARAARARNDAETARGYYERLVETAPESPRAAISEAREYLR